MKIPDFGRRLSRLPTVRIGASASMLNGGRDRMRSLTDGARQQARSRRDITCQTPRVS